MQGELGRRLKQGEWNCCKQKKKKKVAMVARTATIGRGPLRLRLGVPESCWKSAEKERKSVGKVRKRGNSKAD